MGFDRTTEIHRNYEAFQTILPDLLEQHSGKFVVLHNGEVDQFFDTPLAAVKFAENMYPDGSFSVQEVTDQAIEIRVVSDALHHASF